MPPNGGGRSGLWFEAFLAGPLPVDESPIRFPGAVDGAMRHVEIERILLRDRRFQLFLRCELSLTLDEPKAQVSEIPAPACFLLLVHSRQSHEDVALAVIVKF